MVTKYLEGPDKKGPVRWHPLVRVGYFVPFGYMEDPNDRDILLPVEKELELLEQAKVHLKKYSLREVANWLSTESGRYISHTGLNQRVKIETKRQAESAANRVLIKRLEKALEKARRLETARVGGYRTFESASSTEASTSTDGENA